MDHKKSQRLENVCYDLRGPVSDAAAVLEAQGHRILKLNIGNPAAFQLQAPDEIHVDVIQNLKHADAYSPSKGLFQARKAVMQYLQLQNIDCDIEKIWMGNGVSELISIVTSAMLNAGDEVLIPSPDYPLWTAAVTLAGAKAVHYRCNEEDNWEPDLDDIRQKMSDRTRAVVVINPNNPTGVCYSRPCLSGIAQIAETNSLIVLADEIYEKIVYDDHAHIPLASLVNSTPCITFNGLSKSHRLAGFRSGWISATGDWRRATDLIDGINMLCSMRLCANVPAQLAVQTALGGAQSIDKLIAPGGRLYEQRQAAINAFAKLEGVSVIAPQAAMYCFVRVDDAVYNLPDNDEDLVIGFLNEKHIQIVQGSAFNLPSNQHFRFVFLPAAEEIVHAIDQFGEFLQRYRQ